jgi:predicted nucleic acid-binding protein
MPFLIDTNVLIDVSRGHMGAINYIDDLVDSWVLSQVTAMELIVGARDKRELAILDDFLELCVRIPINDAIGARAYALLKTYAKSHGLHVFDSLLAATAMEMTFTLVTLNRKHFQMIAGLSLEVPEY